MNARELALIALKEIDERAAYANLALEPLLTRHRLEPRERALATELVYGVSRRLSTLDWAIGQVASRPLGEMTVWVRNILREAVYQLMYLERIPASAVTNEAVNLARKHGHEGVAKFVNGVLRNFIRRLPDLKYPEDPVQGLALRHSHPDWLVKNWLDRFGEAETVQLLEYGNAPAPVTVRVNRLKTSRAELVSVLQANDLTAEPTRFSPWGLKISGLTGAAGLPNLSAFVAGWFTVQDESSMLVGGVVDPQPGETVIDVAAAPGGKSTHLAELMNNQGRVIALDIHPHKVKLIQEIARRLGTSIVEARKGDAREVGETFPALADRVLVDAPCSGLGTLARRPDARWRKEAQDIEALAAIQQEILASAARAVKPGGVLVYSTCTIEERENEGAIRGFLERHPEFTLESLAPYLPEPLKAEGQNGMLQLLPHRHGTDGFFITRMRRKG